MKPGGWYATGDLGELADDGALFVVGRVKEMIIRSGFNVYPGEIESVLNSWPSIQRSAVVGAPESAGREKVIAYVELRAGQRLDLDALHAFVSERLAPYKRPSNVLVVSGFPMTLSGKVLKRELLGLYPAG
jgi:malonyl-CoA/methylmalonyl-CoA synthetase